MAIGRKISPPTAHVSPFVMHLRKSGIGSRKSGSGSGTRKREREHPPDDLYRSPLDRAKSRLMRRGEYMRRAITTYNFT